MNGLKISFEKGGMLYAKFINKDMLSIENIVEILPINTEVYHTRWCGREIFMHIDTNTKFIGDDISKYVGKFDVTHWLNCKSGVYEETISLFYGAEELRFYGGPLYVETIGRISVEQESLLDEIGERIWLEGKENAKIEIY